MSRLPADHSMRMERVRLSIEGLSVGDALGQQFFPPSRRLLISYRQIPEGTWHYTDDTEMALAIAETLDRHGFIDQDFLASRFADRYVARPSRGYGGGAMDLLAAISSGEPWAKASRELFDGEGSMGNGGAMRAAPVGAYFADEPTRIVDEARRSAEVTHAHPEGIAGAIAIAVAAGWAWRRRHKNERQDLLELVLDCLTPGDLRVGVERAQTLRGESSFERVVGILGNGSRVIARDTVPLCLWCIDRHPDDFAEALWTAYSALGDIDTNGAIVGGVVSLASDPKQITTKWRDCREPL
ncbi:MAG: ADP-ribosylglycohydrolase family protein, partial [Planctomycetota bacterium]